MWNFMGIIFGDMEIVSYLCITKFLSFKKHI